MPWWNAQHAFSVLQNLWKAHSLPCTCQQPNFGDCCLPSANPCGIINRLTNLCNGFLLQLSEIGWPHLRRRQSPPAPRRKLTRASLSWGSPGPSRRQGRPWAASCPTTAAWETGRTTAGPRTSTGRCSCPSPTSRRTPASLRRRRALLTATAPLKLLLCKL